MRLSRFYKLSIICALAFFVYLSCRSQHPPKSPEFAEFEGEGCEIPHFDSPPVKNDPATLDCGSIPEHGTILDKNGQIRSLKPGSKCVWKCVTRVTDEENDESADWLTLDSSKPPVPTCDLVKTRCDTNSLWRSAESYHAYPWQSAKTTKNDDVSPSVLILLVDGVSSEAYQRDMSKTFEFMTRRLEAFHFEKYFKVDLNTFPNTMAFLTGLRVWNHGSDMKTDLKTNGDHDSFLNTRMDNYSFVWNDYRSAGYVTWLWEDFAKYSTFNYAAKGFVDLPTTHYLRPFALARGLQPLVDCVDGRPTAQLFLDTLIHFWRKYRDHKHFSVNINASPSHDKPELLYILDDLYLQFLETADNENLLKNTVLLLMSDHGVRVGKIRATTQGFVEEQLPIFLMHVPKWYLEKHQSFAENLRTNQQRLTSHFDLHSTLLHLLRPDLKTITERNGRGISLFSEIPPNRTCFSAGIPDNVCLCNRRPVKPANPDLVAAAVSKMIANINLKIEKFPMCSQHTLSEIISAEETQDSRRNIRITFRTNPGDALFETLLGADMEVVSSLERLDLYGPTSKCVQERGIRPFCICS